MTLLGFLLVPPILAIVAFHMVRPNTRRLRVSMSAYLARIIHQPNPISSGREGLAVLTGMT